MDYLNIDKEDYDKLLTSDPRMIQSRIIGFILYCKDTRQLLSSMIRGNVADIKHFYEMNDVESLKWKKINAFQGEFYKVVYDRVYTHEEIKKNGRCI
jgi:hypothetical protein